MSWLNTVEKAFPLLTLILRYPIENHLKLREKPRGIDELREQLRSPAKTREIQPQPAPQTLAPAEKPPESGDLERFRAISTAASELEEHPPAPSQPKSGLTNEEILAYQNKEIGSELWQLEKHLAQKCRIFGKPCDCCEKGTFIEGLARETIPIASRIEASIQPYEQLAAWLRQHGAKFSVDAVASGQYDDEYGQLAGELSLLRKKVMANKPPGAPPPESLSLEEAKKLAAEQAAKEVEQLWGSSKET